MSLVSRWSFARSVLFRPWWWLVITAWSIFAFATTVRDNVLSLSLREKLQPLDYLPTWPWWVWGIGFLVLTCTIGFETSYRRMSSLYQELNDRELPGRNADEIAPFRERGRTLTNQWRHLLQHAGASPFQRAAEEAEEWRMNVTQRLERKYGAWVANRFNETLESDSAGSTLSRLAEHDARGERLSDIMYDVGTARIPPRSSDPF